MVSLKKWLLEINGYEQHKIFESGFHANGMDIYSRFKNFGLAIMWTPAVKLYHPWHPFTLVPAEQYNVQLRFIEWRAKNLQYLAINGISERLNDKKFNDEIFMHKFDKTKKMPKMNLFNRLLRKN